MGRKVLPNAPDPIGATASNRFWCVREHFAPHLGLSPSGPRQAQPPPLSINEFVPAKCQRGEARRHCTKTARWRCSANRLIEFGKLARLERFQLPTYWFLAHRGAFEEIWGRKCFVFDQYEL